MCVRCAVMDAVIIAYSLFHGAHDVLSLYTKCQHVLRISLGLGYHPRLKLLQHKYAGRW